jgi:hypothetical protein
MGGYAAGGGEEEYRARADVRNGPETARCRVENARRIGYTLSLGNRRSWVEVAMIWFRRRLGSNFFRLARAVLSLTMKPVRLISDM